MGPVLGNLDPYLGTLNLTCTRLCTQVPKYNTEIWLNINGTYGIRGKDHAEYLVHSCLFLFILFILVYLQNT